MHAAVRRSKPNPDSEPEIVRRVQEGLIPIFRNLPGFIAYCLVNLGNGEHLTLNLYETAEVAEESNKLAADWVRQNVADLLAEPVQRSLSEVLIYETK